jgi:hypothetical protein
MLGCLPPRRLLQSCWIASPACQSKSSGACFSRKRVRSTLVYASSSSYFTAFLMMQTVQIALSSFWPRFKTAGETSVASWLIVETGPADGTAFQLWPASRSASTDRNKALADWRMT